MTTQEVYPDKPEFVFPHLRAAFLEHINTLPKDHLATPKAGEVVLDRDHGITRLKDYAFSQGYILATGGGGTLRARLHCYQGGKETQNNRKLTEAERKRKTKTQAGDCPYKVYVAQYTQKNLPGVWRIGFTNFEHNHPPFSNPFTKDTKERHPGYQRAIEEGLRDRNRAITYRQSTRGAEANSFQLDKKGYYNLMQVRTKLTPVEAAAAMVSGLVAANFRVQLQESYQLDPSTGAIANRVIDQIWFISAEQITLSRRFVSGFSYIADSTFNTNSLRLLLYANVGVSNTGKTFQISQSFIRAEAKDAFAFADECMQKFVWRDDCPMPKVAIADQGAGFVAFLASKANTPATEAMWEQANEMAGGETLWQRGVKLQLCEWHVVAAMMRHLTDSRGFDGKDRTNLQSLIWSYIRAKTNDELLERRNALLAGVRLATDRKFLEDNYFSKEHQFIRKHTNQYANLGARSTQRGESGHHSIKNNLNGQIALNEACVRIARYIQAQVREVYDEEDISRRKSAIGLDRDIFCLLDRKVTHYAIELVRDEWRQTREWATAVFGGNDLYPAGASSSRRRRGSGGTVQDSESEGNSSCDKIYPETPDLDYEPICLLDCQLPIRYGLPCRCFLFHCMLNQDPIPLSFIHPRWHCNGPDIVRDWHMSRVEITPIQHQTREHAQHPRDRDGGDLFQRNGKELILNKSLDILKTHERLTAPEQIKFAITVKDTIDKVSKVFQDRREKQQVMPSEIPKALPTQKQLRKDKQTKRVMLAHDRAERDAKKREQVAKKAQLTADKGKGKATDRDEDGVEVNPLIAEVAAGGEETDWDLDDYRDEAGALDFLDLDQCAQPMFVPGPSDARSQRRTPTPPLYSLLTQRVFYPSSQSSLHTDYGTNQGAIAVEVIEAKTDVSTNTDSDHDEFIDIDVFNNVQRQPESRPRSGPSSTDNGKNSPSPPPYSLLTQTFRRPRTPSPLHSDHSLPFSSPLSIRTRGPLPASQFQNHRRNLHGEEAGSPKGDSSTESSDNNPVKNVSLIGSRIRKPSRKVQSQQQRAVEAAAKALMPKIKRYRTKEEREKDERDAKRRRVEKQQERIQNKAAEEAARQAVKKAREAEQKAKVDAHKAKQAARAASKTAREHEKAEEKRREEAERPQKAAAKALEKQLEQARKKGIIPTKDVSQPQLPESEILYISDN
jgi:hypothetical protein